MKFDAIKARIIATIKAEIEVAEDLLAAWRDDFDDCDANDVHGQDEAAEGIVKALRESRRLRDELAKWE